jgi:hypothetical protein
LLCASGFFFNGDKEMIFHLKFDVKKKEFYVPGCMATIIACCVTCFIPLCGGLVPLKGY